MSAAAFPSVQVEGRRHPGCLCPTPCRIVHCRGGDRHVGNANIPACWTSAGTCQKCHASQRRGAKTKQQRTWGKHRRIWR